MNAERGPFARAPLLTTGKKIVPHMEERKGVGRMASAPPSTSTAASFVLVQDSAVNGNATGISRICRQQGSGAITCADALDGAFGTELAKVAAASASVKDVRHWLRTSGYSFSSDGGTLSQDTSAGGKERCVVEHVAPTSFKHRLTAAAGVATTPSRITCTPEAEHSPYDTATLRATQAGGVHAVHLTHAALGSTSSVCGLDVTHQDEVRCSRADCSTNDVVMGKCPMAQASDPHAAFRLVKLSGWTNGFEDDDDDSSSGVRLKPVDVSVCANGAVNTTTFRECVVRRERFEIDKASCSDTRRCVRADGTPYAADRA